MLVLVLALLLLLMKLLLVDLLLVHIRVGVLRWAMRDVVKSVIVILVQAGEPCGRHSQRADAPGGTMTRRTGENVVKLAPVRSEGTDAMQSKASSAVDERSIDVL